MHKHEKILMKLMAKAAPGLEGIIAGSYRRGKSDSGDIDMLVTTKSDISDKEGRKQFDAFVEALTAAGYMEHILARGAKKCMAVARLNGRHRARRLDLLLTPRDEYPYAIQYFTGSGDFNVALRRHALERGYSLSEHGMAAVETGLPAPPIMKDEKDIFKFLDFEWVPPEGR